MTSHTFASRHIAPHLDDQAHMLKTLGYATLDELMSVVIPEEIRRSTFDLGEYSQALSEEQALLRIKAHAQKNIINTSFIGQGYFNSHTPAVILRNILENPAWYTAYTPYQPEISQGRLEALLNFQQMIMDLTSMDIANASMLDEATAAAEAMTLAMRNSKNPSTTFWMHENIFPQTKEIIQTRAAPLGISIKIFSNPSQITDDGFAVFIQYPANDGSICDHEQLAQECHARQQIVIAATDLLALTLIKPPGEWGADIAIGNSQRFGVPFGFGGPHAAFMATRDSFKRTMPGRLVGVSIDAQGDQALRLALQTREQHIRREKATSNICTAQALLAMMASMYAVYHGPNGLKSIARRVNQMTHAVAQSLKQAGVNVLNATGFDTLTLKVTDADSTHSLAYIQGFNMRVIDNQHIGISFDETSVIHDANKILRLFNAPLITDASIQQQSTSLIPPHLQRTSDYLTHPVFNSHHSEHAMLRYMRALSDKDLALDRSMIPLGSCTMKLNATAQMLPITWPEFAHIHPYAPKGQTEGYRALIHDLEHMLQAATGYAGVSLQPNAGSQGEYAGLLIIQKYHASRGQSHRNICLIPASAHGTNPASAAMANLQVVVVACDQKGNIDLDDLQAKAQQHSDHLAAIMITYPSTHGVFETSVKTVCDIIHQHGGQVYIDGANMNAMVGLCAPGEFGGDVSHLNLHKTFAIPHGGGGPGIGPVCVAEHLVEFLPNLLSVGYQRDAHGIGGISAAPYGSAGVLPITWMYIAMMGTSGLTEATKVAILSANYIAQQLKDDFPLLYSGEKGLVAHECILDTRGVKDSAGITVDDIAKRLMDFGFHAPTMSFPVPGTLMIEPTESEPLAELDRFITAMKTIRSEIKAVEQGLMPQDDNPLKHAPHTAQMLVADQWNHAYSREQAAYPVASLRRTKYWTPVARVDNVYGDRNLFCSCVPISDYE